MFLLEHILPENATGAIKDIYSGFPPEIGPPLPLKLMTASPEFLLSQFETIKYFASHPKLSFLLLAAIRYMAAHTIDYDYCITFNRNVLMATGASEKEITAIIDDPEGAPLEDNEKAMLIFVAKAIRTPEDVQIDDVKTLRSLGWEDSEIFDAVAHGAFMRGHANLMKAFIQK